MGSVLLQDLAHLRFPILRKKKLFVQFYKQQGHVFNMINS